MLSEQLIQAYQQAEYYYRFCGRWHFFSAGCALNELPLPAATHSAAFITAMNPASELLNEQQNQQRARALSNYLAIKHQRWLPAYARDPHQHWPNEYGVLWLNPERGALARALRLFGQHAALASFGQSFALFSA